MRNHVEIQVEITACFNRMEDLNSVKAIICMVPYNFFKNFFLFYLEKVKTQMHLADMKTQNH